MGKRGPQPGAENAGAPRKEIDFKALDSLCELQCTEAEIASFFDIDVNTLEARIKEKKGKTFSEYYEKKRGNGKISLRRAQFRAAIGQEAKVDEGGNLIAPAVPANPTLLIWLGKQLLGQSDTQKVEHSGQIIIQTTPRDEDL